MLFKSAVLTQASGSIGGLTASHNRGGMYFRSRAIPTNPSSARQVAIRSAMSTLSSAWAGLTQLQRDAWTLYGQNVPVTNRLGDSVILTGQQQYLRSNVPRYQAGLARVDAGPTEFTLPTLDQMGLTSVDVAGLVTVTFVDTQDWLDETGAALLIYAGRPQGVGINFFKGPYRYGTAIEGDATTAPTTPGTFTSDFACALGQKVWIYSRLSRLDGRLSVEQSLGPIVVEAAP